MMYCTIADILKDFDEKVLFDLVNDENDRVCAEVDWTDEDDPATARALEQIVSADAEIDGYLRSRYQLPLEDESIPVLIRRLSKDISIYNCKKRRHRDDISDSEEKIYKQCLKTLEAIQNGKINLGIEVADVSSTGAAVKTNKTADDRIFPKNKFLEF